jgi:hypothetical protein
MIPQSVDGPPADSAMAFDDLVIAIAISVAVFWYLLDPGINRILLGRVPLS